MKISLCITTYNKPFELKKVLHHVRRQRQLPDEVLICDDGSGPPTRDMIEKEQVTFPVPLVHLWHKDEGWRVSRSRNEGIKRASGSLVIFIDGDCVPHPCFLGDHVRLARKGHMVFGDRSHVKAPHLKAFHYSISNLVWYILSRRIAKRHLAVRNPFEHAKTISVDKVSALQLAETVLGCNLSFWKSDAMRVNGFNEDLTGWALEDVEFSARMLVSGLKGLKVRRLACVYHLDHGMSSYDREMVLGYTEAVLRTQRYWTSHGIEKSYVNG